MIYYIVFILSVLVALGAGVRAGVSDFRGLVIPNICHVIIVGAFFPAAAAVYFSHIHMRGMGHLGTHFIVAAVMLVITFAMFWLKIFGGADAKMLSAYSLWVGLKGVTAMLFYMAISGGVLAVAALIIARAKPFKNLREGSWLAQLQSGKSRIPYGIPIVIGAFSAFYYLGFLNLSLPGEFAEAVSRGGS